MQRIIETKFYLFDQNNSGGRYLDNEEDGIAKNICIEAINVDDAISRMREITYNYSDYCTCCGERWSSWIDEEDGTDEPTKQNIPLKEYIEKEVEAVKNGGLDFNDNAAIHYLDGKIEWLGNKPNPRRGR